MSTVDVIQSPSALVEVASVYGALVEVLGVGAQGPAGGGSSSLNVASGEAPGGLKNGVNRLFTLDHIPIFLNLKWGGLSQSEGVDFTINGSDITLLRDGPLADDSFIADYIW